MRPSGNSGVDPNIDNDSVFKPYRWWWRSSSKCPRRGRRPACGCKHDINIDDVESHSRRTTRHGIGRQRHGNGQKKRNDASRGSSRFPILVRPSPSTWSVPRQDRLRRRITARRAIIGNPIRAPTFPSLHPVPTDPIGRRPAPRTITGSWYLPRPTAGADVCSVRQSSTSKRWTRFETHVGRGSDTPSRPMQKKQQSNKRRSPPGS